MKSWKDMIGTCFGLADRPFAQHPSSEQDAFELLGELRTRDVGWTTFERELRAQLAQMPKLNTEEQIRLVEHYFRTWLLD